MKNPIVDFFKKPEEFVKNASGKTIFMIFIVNFLVKTSYNILSSHKFPPEMSFDFVGIVNPTIIEFILSHLISGFLFFGVFLIFLVIHINEKTLLKILVDLITASLSLFFISNYSKTSSFIYLGFILPMLIFFLKRNFTTYVMSLRIMISIQILNIISTIILYLSEILSSNILFITTLFIYSILSFGYFVKLFRASYELSIKRIIFYSIISISVAIICGFAVHKLQIFSQNTIKLILYN